MSPLLKHLLVFRSTYIILLTPLILLPLPILYGTSEARCAYILLIMAVYWITEPVPIFVTALLPIVGLPLAGVMSSRAVASSYIGESGIVFAGGLVVAVAIEHSNLHKRLAIFIIIKIGHSPRLLIAGFMLTTMLLSMWISNVGATAIMITVVQGILHITSGRKDSEEVAMEDQNETTLSTGMNGENVPSMDPERNHGGQQLKINDQNIEVKSYQTSLSSVSKLVSDPEDELEQNKFKRLKYGYYLSIAYAANIGGTGVITGTPPNLILMGVLAESFTESTGVNFTSWMILNTPSMLICTVVGCIWLQYRYIGFGKGSLAEDTPENKLKVENFIKDEYKKLGPMTYHEKTIAVLFLILIPLWIFRDPGFLYGWGRFLEDMYGGSVKIGDSVPVLLVIFLYFVLPANNPFRFKKINGSYNFKSSESLLNWKLLEEKVGWGLIILLGGGITMAKASDASGLSRMMGETLSKLGGISPPIFLLLITTLTAGVTEILSNNATTSMLLPVLRELSLGVCSNPLYFMIPATVAASYAFMLPVATPANALVYYAGNLPSTEMMKTGFLMNVICVAILNIFINILGGAVFGMHDMPSWANSSSSGTFPNC